MSDFHRVKRLPPYVFEQVNRIKAAARNNGADIIDLGMGNPDLPAPRHVIEKMIETRSQIVLLDIDMPDKDGLTLLQEIKRLDMSIQVIMVTGMVSINTLLKATHLGAEACIFKPLTDFKKLTDAVSQASKKIDQRWYDMQDWVARNPGAAREVTAAEDALRSEMMRKAKKLAAK
jgi:DNA-binding NtrC family response regulator